MISLLSAIAVCATQLARSCDLLYQDQGKIRVQACGCRYSTKAAITAGLLGCRQKASTHASRSRYKIPHTRS